MLKIRHKELARLLGVSEKYSRTLLYRRKLRLTNNHLDDIIDIITQRRLYAHNRPSRKTKRGGETA
jgi:hypothetical protein